MVGKGPACCYPNRATMGHKCHHCTNILGVKVTDTMVFRVLETVGSKRGLPSNEGKLFFISVELGPNAGHGLLILEVSRSHTTTHHSR